MIGPNELRGLRRAIDSGDWRQYHGDFIADLSELVEIAETLQAMPKIDFKREMEWVERVGTSNPHVVHTLRRMVMNIDMKIQPLKGYMK